MQPNPASQARRHGPHRHRLYTATGFLLVGSLGYIGLVDPHNRNSVYPLCPFKWLTGWNCPFCGGLRMTHDLLHGNLAAAVNDNVLLLVGIPILAACILVGRRHGKSLPLIPATLTIVAALAAWTVLRNLPGFSLIPTTSGG
jgi:hypothetical protein